MPFCPKCRKQYEENASYCSSCRAPLTRQSQPLQATQPLVPPYAPSRQGIGTEGRKFSILGIVFACLSLIVLPIAFGALAVILGVIGVLKNDAKLGIIAIVLGVLPVLSPFLALLFF